MKPYLYLFMDSLGLNWDRKDLCIQPDTSEEEKGNISAIDTELHLCAVSFQLVKLPYEIW